ncbi:MULTISPECIES: SDR family NAD(P)-dependent oxidoreductase [unclassified Rhizobium]|jgi:short-subunit dehydrogenase|uniref:SDR family NAD(P)-dependent oxidoreductase n=1 Tax=unclassified Rhizobium TaxID=2613769 RepID=UPI000DDAA4D3|nr:SDR family oxidoreductase [Rhizobium sp. UBA1881]
MSTASLGTALVTGASSGIGATYADRLAKRGYDLVLVARDVARLQALADRLTGEAGVKVSVLPADLTDRADVRIVEKRLREDADISLLVNNAGIGPKGTLVEDDIDYLETMIELNVVAANRLAVAAAQAFAERGRGAIINIASVVAYIPERFNGTYSATKAFVLNLTQAIHSEVAERGVKVQAVMPGLTRTEIFERVGRSFDQMPPSMVMDVNDMVDAALAGFDQGELVTIPSLPDSGDLDVATAARLALGPNLSHNKPAARYGVTAG